MKRTSTLSILLLVTAVAFAQEPYTISGTIYDSSAHPPSPPLPLR